MNLHFESGYAKKIFLFVTWIFSLALMFAKSPSKIIVLSPSSGEIMYAIGAGNQVAARADVCDYPPEILQKPKVGGFDGKSLSLETILSFEPDFVYLTAGMHDHLQKPLNQLGIKTYTSKGDSVNSVIEEILDIGKITGHKKEAEKLVAEIRADFQKASEKVSAKGKSKIRLYWEVWNVPYMSAGQGSFINDLIFRSGYENIFSEVNQSYPIVSEEAIIASLPEVMIIPASEGATVESIKLRRGWQEIPAVKNGRILIVDDNLFTRPGPRIGKVALELAEDL